MKKELATHPNLHLDAILYGNNLADTSSRETAAMLKAYPNLKGVIAPTTVGLAAAGKAFKDAGLIGKVQLTGLGVPADMKTYFDDGTCSQMLLGVPIDTGYAATFVAAGLARGQIKGTVGENLKLGRMGVVSIDRAGPCLRAGAGRGHQGYHRRLRPDAVELTRPPRAGDTAGRCCWTGTTPRRSIP